MKQIFQVLNYAHLVGDAWREMQKENFGYEVKTTFFEDFTIAEIVAHKEGVIDTYERAMSEWLDNIEYITEFVLVLNHKCWQHHGEGRIELSKLYSDLYYKAYDKVANHYEGDDEKSYYFWKTLD